MKFKAFIITIIVVLSLSGKGYPNPGENTPSAAGNQPALREIVMCPTKNHTAGELYNKGLELSGKGDFESAMKAYSRAIELDANYCDAMDNLGQLLRRQGKFEEAVYWYRRSIGVLPGNHVAHLNLAVAYRYQGKMDDAISEYRILLKMNSDDPEVYYGLGTVYLASGELDVASEQFKKAEQLYLKLNSPLVADAHYELGVIYYQMKDYGKSIEYLARSLPAKQNDPRVHYALGLCYLEEGKDLNQARKYLKRAEELGANIPPEVLRKAGL
ncbi:MAG: tetratricopeptide repeat protein [Syntrophobacteraceae bacterium]